MQNIKYFICSEKGVTSIEYALLASLIAMMILASVNTLGGSVKALYEDVAQKVSDALNG